jgi:GDP/UDP-N,N'-diacetylbacillosamine 2-epimerase (hydrolysing)
VGALRKIRIGVLTSSRADFGIYLPLLKAMKADDYFDVNIIAFGTHLSSYHGNTIEDIKASGFHVPYTISSLMSNDDAGSIASSFGLTALKFADFWKEAHGRFDLVFCLGDRFEMAAAVFAGIPLQIKFAHIHGGETTLGAIDNVYRHSITLASSLHFVAAAPFKEKVDQLTGNPAACFVTGALSLDNLDQIQFLDNESFQSKWNVNLSSKFILVTLHPETVAFERNHFFASEFTTALRELLNDREILITLPNGDTNGSVYRKAFSELANEFPEAVSLIENFGTQSYFTCMKSADLLLGNTSSGIIEAASLGKYVVNVGDRQKGRLTSGNVVTVPFESNAIVKACRERFSMTYSGENVYKVGNAAKLMIEKLKQLEFK